MASCFDQAIIPRGGCWLSSHVLEGFSSSCGERFLIGTQASHCSVSKPDTGFGVWLIRLQILERLGLAPHLDNDSTTTVQTDQTQLNCGHLYPYRVSNQEPVESAVGNSGIFRCQHQDQDLDALTPGCLSLGLPCISHALCQTHKRTLTTRLPRKLLLVGLGLR